MDKKQSSRQPQRRRRSALRYYGGVPRGPSANTMIYTAGYEYGNLAANTSGVLSSADISGSITAFDSTEYTYVTGLFSEIKLLNLTVTFTCCSVGGQNRSRALIGTDMNSNYTTHASTPLTAQQVYNLPRLVYLQLNDTVEPFQYQMIVPRNLEFSSITNDAPTVPTPYAGSPGCVYVFANDLSASRVYLKVDVRATWLLRGRH